MRKETGLDYERAIRRAVLAAFAWDDTLRTPADLARAAGFSAFHFSRMFGGMMGESPGEYAGLGAAWGTLFGQWLPASGFQSDDSRPCFETYLNDCEKVSPDELRTELFLPIR